MIAQIRKRGFEDGYKAAKDAKDSGKSVKIILKFEADDKQMAKKFSEELKVNREKSFHFAVVYSFGYDSGILEAIYE